MKMKNNNQKLKGKEKKRNINIDLAVLPSHDIRYAINIAFHSSSFFILTLLYPYLRSIFVNTF